MHPERLFHEEALQGMLERAARMKSHEKTFHSQDAIGR
jgi:hypothetical protein